MVHTKWDRRKSPAKIFISTLTLLLSSCSWWSSKPDTHSLIKCPDGKQIVVRFSNAGETIAGIRRFYEIKQRQGTSEKYTAIKYPSGYAVQIRIEPELAIKCNVTTIRSDELSKY